MVDISKTLREIRNSFGLTQKELSEKIGVKSYIIANWEINRSAPSISDLIKLADFYQVSVDYLIGREDDFGNAVSTTVYEQLPKDERKLIEQYRSLSKLEREAVDMQIKALLTRGNK